MAGLYIHIPFCQQACHYCDFHFSTSGKTRKAMIAALCQEIELRLSYLGTDTLDSLYFGGGTPSLLEEHELESIFSTVHRHFTLAAEAEITLEANPDDLKPEKIAMLKNSPINRLSIGIQSFDDAILRWMNRSHDSQTAYQALEAAGKAGFRSLSLDLIYGIPLTDEKYWQKQLDIAFSMPVQHLSAYCLTVEKGTALAHFVQKGKTPLADEGLSLDNFQRLREHAQAHDWEQYEISNFARPGYRAQHNTAYWLGKPYLGIGPSAHSYNGTSRQWNVSSNPKYIQAVQKGENFYETEKLQPEDQYNELLITRLRMLEGVSEADIPADFRTHFNEQAHHALKRGRLIQENNRLRIHPDYLFCSDDVISDLMWG